MATIKFADEMEQEGQPQPPARSERLPQSAPTGEKIGPTIKFADEQESEGKTWDDRANQFVYGVNAEAIPGVLYVLGYPIQKVGEGLAWASEKAAELAGEGEVADNLRSAATSLRNPVGGSQQLIKSYDDLMRDLDIPYGAPAGSDDTLGKMVQGAGREIAGGMMTGGVARGAVPLATQGTTARAVLEGLSTPASRGGVATEVGAGTGAAVGGTLSQNVLGTSLPGELIGGAGGGVAAQGRDLAGAVNLARTDAGVEARAAEALKLGASDPRRAARNIDANTRAIDDLPYNPRTAEVADDPGLAVMDRGVATGPRQKEVVENIVSNRARLEGAIADEVAPVGADAGRASTTAKATLENREAAYKGKTNELYKRAFDSDELVVPAPLQTRMKFLSQLIDDGELAVSPAVTARVRTIMGLGGADDMPVSLKAIERIRQQTNKIQPQAGTDDIEVIAGIRKAIDDFYAETPALGKQKADIEKARGFVRENAPKFSKDEAPLIRKILDDPSLSDERALDQILGRGTKGFQQLATAINPGRARNLTQQWIEGKLRGKLESDNGPMTAATAGRWLDSNKDLYIRAYGTDQFNRARKLITAYGMWQRPARQTQTVPGSMTAQNQGAGLAVKNIDTAVNTLLSLYGGLPASQGVVGRTLGGLEAAYMRQGAVEDLVVRALNDPELAKRLLLLNPNQLNIPNMQATIRGAAREGAAQGARQQLRTEAVEE